MSWESEITRKVDSLSQKLDKFLSQDRASRSLDTGWIKSSYPWVYDSATSFKIIGIDVTSVYKPGTRVKYNDGSKDYGTVISSSYSAGTTNTTVNLASNSDYSVGNTTLTDCYYSYSNPPDYPDLFTCPLTVYQNGARTASTYLSKFRVQGKSASLWGDFIITNAGAVANMISVQNLPIASANAITNHVVGSFEYTRSGVILYVGVCMLNTDGYTIKFCVSGSVDMLGLSPSFAVAPNDGLGFEIEYLIA